MEIVKAALFAVALTSAGCSSHCKYPVVVMALYNHYNVGVVGFGDHEFKIIVEAAHKWESECRGSLMVSVGSGCEKMHAGNDVCIRPGKLQKWLAFTSFGRPNEAQSVIEIDVDDYTWVDAAFSHVVQHEFGHAFGLNHGDKGTVMFPWSRSDVDQQPEGAQDVTCADVAQYHAIRGWRNVCR